MSGLHIKSDFTDFYDILSDKESLITYNRYLKDCKQRGSALKYLRSIGVRTIDIKQVTQFFRGDGPIVVYTNPKGHHGKGKQVMTVDEAFQFYGNCIASKYYDTGGVTIKYLQIGKRRYALYFKKDNIVSIKDNIMIKEDDPFKIGRLVYIKELESMYNRLIGLPIFSIDYISSGKMMLATDFNEVESLESIEMHKYITANDVIAEIKDSLQVYNKIG